MFQGLREELERVSTKQQVRACDCSKASLLLFVPPHVLQVYIYLCRPLQKLFGLLAEQQVRQLMFGKDSEQRTTNQCTML